jgi:hypothetical protein
MTTSFVERLARELKMLIEYHHSDRGWERTQITFKRKRSDKFPLGSVCLELCPGCCGIVVISYPVGCALWKETLDAMMRAGRDDGYTLWMATQVEPNKIDAFKHAGFTADVRFQNFYHTHRGGNFVEVLTKSAFKTEEILNHDVSHEWDRHVEQPRQPLGV